MLQEAQVRKSSYVPDPGVDYDPDSYHSCTVYAGTIVRQVSTSSLGMQFTCPAVATPAIQT